MGQETCHRIDREEPWLRVAVKQPCSSPCSWRPCLSSEEPELRMRDRSWEGWRCRGASLQRGLKLGRLSRAHAPGSLRRALAHIAAMRIRVGAPRSCRHLHKLLTKHQTLPCPYLTPSSSTVAAALGRSFVPGLPWASRGRRGGTFCN